MKKAIQFIVNIITFPFRSFANWVSNVSRAIRNFLLEEPEDRPVGDSIQHAIEQPEGLVEHINALRRHLFRSIVVLVLFSVVAFIFLPDLMDWIAQPIGGVEELEAVEVTEPIGVGMRVVILAGFTAALPYITYEIFLFIAPALSRRARLIGLLAIPMVVVFFFAGMAFAYYVILPTGLPVLLSFMNVPTQIRPSSYIRFVTGMMFWLGLVFEFPLLSYVLSMMRILSAKALASNWRIAVVGMAVLAAVITPTIDPVNMMLVMVPLMGLYSLSILLAYIAGGTDKKK
ncbi:MAG: twin-arginine translocase subunit TatC [Anaerolineales bacterium]